LHIIAGSYFFNYIYWSFPRDYRVESYITFLTQAYKNDVVLSKQKDNLRLFIDYAHKNSIQLIVVVLPFFNDIELSNSMYVNDIVNFLEANNVSTINVSALASNIPLSERMININDAHASPKVNRMIAQEIIKKLKY
jgi:hypothetical protein